MGLAPRPGESSRADKQKRRAVVVSITIDGVTKTVMPNNLPLRDSSAVRKATGGLPVSAFLGSEDRIDVDSLKVLWWMARRTSGEPDLTADDIDKDWPTEIDENTISVEVDDGEDVLAGNEDASPES